MKGENGIGPRMKNAAFLVNCRLSYRHFDVGTCNSLASTFICFQSFILNKKTDWYDNTEINLPCLMRRTVKIVDNIQI